MQPFDNTARDPFYGEGCRWPEAGMPAWGQPSTLFAAIRLVDATQAIHPQTRKAMMSNLARLVRLLDRPKGKRHRGASETIQQHSGELPADP
jgi:hypothetical protein